MIKEIMRLLNKVSAVQIIPAYSSEAPPKKPYITYATISSKSYDFFGTTYENYIQNEDKYLESTKYRVETNIQFDVYESHQGEVLNTATRFKELILFILRYDFSRINTGIVKFTDIKMLREEISNKYEYRATFDVTFEYINLTKEREVLIAREVELIANEHSKNRIKGVRNGNL